jgi:predicted oxidoreductase
VADVTGEMERFIKKKLLGDLGVEKISGADIFGNEKLENCLL